MYKCYLRLEDCPLPIVFSLSTNTSVFQYDHRGSRLKVCRFKQEVVSDNMISCDSRSWKAKIRRQAGDKLSRFQWVLCIDSESISGSRACGNFQSYLPQFTDKTVNPRTSPAPLFSPPLDMIRKYSLPPKFSHNLFPWKTVPHHPCSSLRLVHTKALCTSRDSHHPVQSTLPN